MQIPSLLLERLEEWPISSEMKVDLLLRVVTSLCMTYDPKICVDKVTTYHLNSDI